MRGPWTIWGLIVIDFLILCVIVAMLWAINRLPRVRPTHDQATRDLLDHFAQYITDHHGLRHTPDDDCFACQLWHAHDELKSALSE